MGKASRRKKNAGAGFKPAHTDVGMPVPVGATGRSPLQWPVVFVILAACALLIYSNTFSVPFLYDDMRTITENEMVRDLSRLPFFAGTRYVGSLTFALNYHFGGTNVFGYHLVNLLIHVANGFLVYMFVLLLWRAFVFGQARGPAPTENGRDESRPYGQFVAFATALIFIAHPIQTQAVTYIVQRFASLVTLFYLAACVCYLKWRLASIPVPVPAGARRAAPLLWYLGAILSTFLATKSKENGFTLPFAIVLMEWVFFGPVGAYCNTPVRERARVREWARRAVPLLPFLLMLLIVPFSHADVLGEGQPSGEWTLSRSDYLFTQFRVILTYLRLLVLPVNQTLDYDYPIYRFFLDPAVFFSFLFHALVVGFSLYAVFRRRSSGNGPHRAYGNTPLLVAFGVLWFYLALSVESSVVPIQDVIYEHRLYLPSVGFFLAVVAATAWFATGRGDWPVARMGTIILALCVVAVLGAATYRRNFVWADGVTLWRDVVVKMDDFVLPEIGDPHPALSWQDRVERAPKIARAHVNLGTAYTEQGRYDEAQREFETALKFQPDYAEALHNLGSIYGTRGQLEEALRFYETALELRPDYPEARKNLGLAAEAYKVFLNKTIENYRNDLSLHGDRAETHFKLGETYAKMGMLNEAIQAC